MISMRKQLFAILICTGIITIFLTSGAVTIALNNRFTEYIEQTTHKKSLETIKQIEIIYEETTSWDKVFESEFLEDVYQDNFWLSILNSDKEFMWGTTEEDLVQRIRVPNYSAFTGTKFDNLEADRYRFEDVPIMNEGEIVGYVRTGYFPAFLIAIEDSDFQVDINKSLIHTGVIAIICFSIASVYITRIFTKPIYAVAKTSVQLAEGKYTARYKKQSRIIELENLRHSMNYLAEKLEQQDILRKKLISDVSHEIRTPLHILQSNLEAMIDGIYPTDEEQMQVLYEEVVRFGSLLSNLDKLKDIEQDYVHKREEIYINTCLQEIFQTFKIVAQERHIQYKLNIHESHSVMIDADINGIKQILMNLLSNAFKFTQKGQISVSTSVEGKMVHIIIQDTGIGIEEEDLPYIFERMYRGDKSREQYEGSGIGLTIVKKLVENHKGKISVKSEAGVGSQFTISLPITRMSRSQVIKNLTLTKIDAKE